MNEPRQIVFENGIIAGAPMAPTRPGEMRSLGIGADGERLESSYPAVATQLMVHVPPGASPQFLRRLDVILSVHYHLLGDLALTDYEDRRVFYTPTGLARSIWGGKGGRQNSQIRHAIDYLYWANLRIRTENLSESVRVGWDVPRNFELRILSSRSEPGDEVVLEDSSFPLSWISYSEEYMTLIRHDRSVQIDVELLAQFSRPLEKAFYRTLSWMRGVGRDRISIPELFHRTGSNRQQNQYGAHARKAYESAWQVLQHYRYLASEPRFELGSSGGWEMIVDWGDPVELPSGADSLFRILIRNLGLDPREAGHAITQNKIRTARLVQAWKNGGMVQTHPTWAATFLEAFRSEHWTFENPLEDAANRTSTSTEPWTARRGAIAPNPQGELLTQSTADADQPIGPSRRDQLLDWPSLSKMSGAWDDLLHQVLPPLLRAAGERAPERALSDERLRRRLRLASEHLGWTHTIQALYTAAEKLRPSIALPGSYLAASLENAAGPSGSVPQPAAPAPIRASTPASEDTQAEARLLTSMRGWQDRLRESPREGDARRALEFARGHRERGTASMNEQLRAGLSVLEETAKGILRHTDT